MTRELTIIGGTRHLSTRVVHRLLERGLRIKLIARDPAKARALFGDAVTVIHGDVADPQSLEAALAGTETLYIHLNTEFVDPSIPFYTEREGVQNIVGAAEAAGVTHLVQIAGIEATHPEFFTAGILNTHAVREVGMQAVSASRIPHTFLTCSLFLDSLPKLVSDGAMAAFGPQDGTIFFTNTEQLAEHLFHVAGNPDAFGRSITVQGSEGLDFATGASRFFASFDPTVNVIHLPIEAIASFGLPPEQAAFLQHVVEVTSGLKETFVSEGVHRAFGAPPLTIDGFGEKLRGELEGAR